MTARRLDFNYTTINGQLGRLLTALVSVALFVAVITSCSSGEDAVEPVEEPTVNESAILDDVLQPRTSNIAFAAAPGRRPGLTSLEALEEVEVAAGRKLDVVRAYVDWESEFPDQRHQTIVDGDRGLFLSLRPRRASGEPVPWRDIADARLGDPVFAEMQSWIDALVAFDAATNAPMMVTFHHEPELETEFGSSEEFVAAWRRVADALRERAPEIELVWVVTGYGLRSDDIDIEAWYPGDDAVDRIGADLFNWFGCRGEPEPWRTVQETLSPLITFGAAHPEVPLVIAEIGSDEDDEQPDRKAQWFDDLAELLGTAPYEQISLVSFFHNDHSDTTTCDWWVTSSDVMRDTFGLVANSLTFGGGEARPATARCAINRRVVALSSDQGLADIDGDAVVDFVFGTENRFVGVGEQGDDGRNQRVILQFDAIGALEADERVELQLRLARRAELADGPARLVLLDDPTVSGLDAFDSSGLIIAEPLFDANTAGGWYSIDITELIGTGEPTAFRLELSSPPSINDLVDPYLVGMSEADDLAARPQLLVRAC